MKKQKQRWAWYKKNCGCGISVEGGNNCGILYCGTFPITAGFVFCIPYFRKNVLYTKFLNIKKLNNANAQLFCFEGPFKRFKILKSHKIPPKIRYFVFSIFSKAAVFCIAINKATCGNTKIPCPIPLKCPLPTSVKKWKKVLIINYS